MELDLIFTPLISVFTLVATKLLLVDVYAIKMKSNGAYRILQWQLHNECRPPNKQVQ